MASDQGDGVQVDTQKSNATTHETDNSHNDVDEETTSTPKKQKLDEEGSAKRGRRAKNKESDMMAEARALLGDNLDQSEGRRLRKRTETPKAIEKPVEKKTTPKGRTPRGQKATPKKAEEPEETSQDNSKDDSKSEEAEKSTPAAADSPVTNGTDSKTDADEVKADAMDTTPAAAAETSPEKSHANNADAGNHVAPEVEAAPKTDGVVNDVAEPEKNGE